MDGVWIFLNGDRGLNCLRQLAIAGIKLARIVIPPTHFGVFGKGDDWLFGGAPVDMCNDVNNPEFVAFVRQQNARRAVVAGFSTIFHKPLIDAFPGGILNLHAGRVPQYRGGSPLNWQIINGEQFAGLSILQMTEGIDDGPVVCSQLIPIEYDDDIASMHAKANELFGPMLVSALINAKPPLLQDDSQARYWLQRNDSDGRIDWHRMTAVQIYNLVRATSKPYPGAHSGNLRIWKVKPAAIYGPPGRVGYIQGRRFVCCLEGAIELIEFTGTPPKHGSYLS